MNFDDLDLQMRQYETGDDRLVQQGVFLVARIDGRSFTRLTKEICHFEAPFDVRFRDLMISAVSHLMNCGFRIIYGYTQSDEISVLFHPSELVFQRKARKLLSVLAGETSAQFSVGLGRAAAFDCRLCELPTADLVGDYFRWRQMDARRNALNAHCYWLLRKEGVDKRRATEQLQGLSVEAKLALLGARGIDFDKVPHWQKSGVGLRFVQTVREGFNPVKQQTVETLRRTLEPNFELPTGDAYSRYIADILKEASDN